MADDLIATKPGVMCASAQALAQLTLPNGDSRSHEAAATPAQQALAQSGGCIDIQPGITVNVQTAHKNTSVVTYQQPGSATSETFVIPNIDFTPVFTDDSAASQTTAQVQAEDRSQTTTQTSAAAVPSGYWVAQRVPGAAGDTIELLEDERITPALQQQMWGSGAAEEGLPGKDLKPLAKAQLRLVSASGAIAATRQLDYPLARVETAPLHGVPGPVLFMTVDATAPMGSYSGPATEILMPAQQSLDAMQYATDDGKSGALVLARTGKANWKISPSRKGGADEIQQVASAPGTGDDFVTRYATYRFIGGKWQLTQRQEPGLWESDGDFPNRNLFP
ncbi:hypothetical protein PQQ96_21205 [Paraburkholderia sediminicola]|uniref:hypothetical protein n=1 Tax=Paraburkholderia sediminicola TaxID=458836 RepID=UPI0038BD01A1